MAAEAAILGTPAIHIESNSKGIATGSFSGNFRSSATNTAPLFLR